MTKFKEWLRSFGLLDVPTFIALFALIIALIMFYDNKDIIIGDYSYTTKSENHLINKLHVDSKVLKKFASLKVEKYCSKSDFVSAVGKAYGGDLNSEFLRIIVAAAEKKWRLNLDFALLPILLTIVLFLNLIYLIPKKNSLISENEELKEELNNKDIIVNGHTELINDLCLCNVKQPYGKLGDTTYSNDNIKKNIKNYHRFNLVGIFADKWIGGVNKIKKFEEFLTEFNAGVHQGKGDEEIKFLLTDPLHENAIEKFGDTKKDLLNYHDNYKQLYNISKKYKYFKCKIVTYFPIFRYRKLNDETIISDYHFHLEENKPGEQRPHLVFEYRDKKDCQNYVNNENDKTEPCGLVGAFDTYFTNCWNEAEDLQKYLENEETKKNYEALKRSTTKNFV